MDAREFLLRCDGHYKIVSTDALSHDEVREAEQAGTLWVDEDTSLGWALIPAEN